MPELDRPVLKSKDLSGDVESCCLNDEVPPKLNEDDWFLEESPKPNLDEVELLLDEPPMNGARPVPVLIILTSY